MDNLTQLQNEYVFFTDMLKSLERKKKKTESKNHLGELFMKF